MFDMEERCFAAIDLGTNSCRLKIVDAKGRKVYQDSVPTKLGEGLQAQMMLTPEALDRGMECFCQYAQILSKYNVVKIRAIATEACRLAKNAGDFIRKVYEKTGISIEIVSPYEEARLNLCGAISHVREKTPYVVVIDLGGGSTEICLATNNANPEILTTVSIPWGAITASDAFGLATYNPEGAKRLSVEINRWVEGFKKSSNFNGVVQDCCCVATSSTPLRLAALIKKHSTYDRDKCDGLKFNAKDVEKTLEALKSMTVEDMAQNPCIGERRSNIFFAAVYMFNDICSGLGIDSIIASLRSAKDGIVEELIKNDKVNQISQGSARSQNLGSSSKNSKVKK